MDEKAIAFAVITKANLLLSVTPIPILLALFTRLLTVDTKYMNEYKNTKESN